MIGPGTGVRVYVACGVTDMRKGIAGLAALTQDVLRQKPTGGAVFAFRGRSTRHVGRRADLRGTRKLKWAI
jgi:transposase